MRTATLIVAAVSSLSLAAPAVAQQRSMQGARPSMQAPRMPSTAIPRMNPPRGGGWQHGAPRPGGWKPTPGVPRPGGWQPGKPGHWNPGTPGWKPGTPGHWNPGRPGNWKPGTHRPGWRWGEKIRGRWHAGWKAPGGWGAYRRPVRGWTLPSYWIGGGFWISDWSSWGLSSPPYGYNWVRYYDDAVLVDRGGRVWDSVSGLDWDRDDYAYEGDEGYYEGEDRGYERDGYYEGEADDRGPGADYDAPDYRDDDYAYREAPRVHAVPARPLRCVANCHGGYAYGGGYYYGAPTTTTVVIQSAPVVTTTVTETVEEVTYGGGTRVVRRAPSKKLYRAPVKVRSKTCYCR
ncbi:RcnB family protein [Sphingomonas sp. MS122]|uniref:RcnB family protein n=1 Tax=Sphingomonas sp. MS122 TaxID=3412683 RepID=UPI003C2B14F3